MVLMEHRQPGIQVDSRFLFKVRSGLRRAMSCLAVSKYDPHKTLAHAWVRCCVVQEPCGRRNFIVSLFDISTNIKEK